MLIFFLLEVIEMITKGTSFILDMKVDSVSEDKSKHALVDVSMTD